MKIGLALSGGGVLGAAHLGLLDEIEKNNIKLTMISGTSSGAIIGALYANGGMAKINQFITLLEKDGFFSKKSLAFNTPDKIFSKIKLALKETLSTDNFYDLSISFFCTVTDIASGEKKIISKGSLIDAVMASSAYPGVFPVQNIDGHHYIDGGVTSNLPAKILKEKGADFIIGSSLYGVSKLKTDEQGSLKTNRIEVAMRAIDIMQKKLAEAEEKFCDFYLHPEVESFSWYRFDRFNEIRQQGNMYVGEEMARLLAKLKKTKKGSFWRKLLNV